jgi:hypothetical protein
MMNNVATRLLARVARPFAQRIVAERSPDQSIGRSGDGGVYLRRWHLYKGRWCRVYIHLFFRDDPDVHHDHPWASVSLSLSGRLDEEYRCAGGTGARMIWAGALVCRGANFAHRLRVLDRGAMTLFITGPKTRSWGFLCPEGWRHWEDFDRAGCD